MPFCSSCGTSVHDRDVFCASCGSRQPQPTSALPPPRMVDPLESLTPRTASILCYIPVVGWVAAVIVLAAQRFRQDAVVRFHAFQGLYLFAAWLVVQWAVRPIFRTFAEPYRVDQLLEAVILGASIFMIIKASHRELYSLPVIGDLAHRSATES